MANNGRNRRQKTVVDRQFQVKWVMSGLLFAAIVAAVMALPFLSLFNTAQTFLERSSTQAAEQIREDMRFAIATFLFSCIALACGWAIYSLKRSHKVAGAAYKMRQFMDGRTLDNLNQQVQLRAGDELQAVADGMNDMLARLQQQRDAELKTEAPYFAPEPEDAST